MDKAIDDIAQRTLRLIARRPGTVLGKVILAAILMMSVLLVGSMWMAHQSSLERISAEVRQQRTVEVLDLTAELRIATISTMRGERGYLLTHDESFLQPYYEGRQGIALALPELRARLSDIPEQSERIVVLAGLFRDHLDVMSDLVALERADQHAQALVRIRSGESRNSITAILDALDELDSAEKQMLAQRTLRADRAARSNEIFDYATGAIGLVLLALALFTLSALRRSMARETVVMAELRRIATTDELTGLANRRETLAALDRMLGAARRTGRPLSIAILDIDHFKRVNDSYGHPAGDEVIRRVAEMALQIMREQDLVGRLGGEEFVIAFPDCDADAAFAACERLRAAIANLLILLPEGVALTVTLSSGVAQWTEADDRTHLIARADEALYLAKSGGRDQVRLAA